jgi:hypothetical protein
MHGRASTVATNPVRIQGINETPLVQDWAGDLEPSIT